MLTKGSASPVAYVPTAYEMPGHSRISGGHDEPCYAPGRGRCALWGLLQDCQANYDFRRPTTHKAHHARENPSTSLGISSGTGYGRGGDDAAATND